MIVDRAGRFLRPLMLLALVAVLLFALAATDGAPSPSLAPPALVHDSFTTCRQAHGRLAVRFRPIASNGTRSAGKENER
jgi:hypothetical protein